MLQRNLRQEGAPHDCEQDAAAAMQLVNYAIQHGVPPPMEAPQVKASLPCLMDLATNQIMHNMIKAATLHTASIYCKWTSVHMTHSLKPG